MFNNTTDKVAEKPLTAHDLWATSSGPTRVVQAGRIPAFMLPLGGMAVRHRKGATAERFRLTTELDGIQLKEPQPRQIVYRQKNRKLKCFTITSLKCEHVRLFRRENSDAFNVRWWSSGNTLASPRNPNGNGRILFDWRVNRSSQPGQLLGRRSVGRAHRSHRSSVNTFACSDVKIQMRPTRSPRMSDVRGSNPGTATGYALLMSSNKSETRVQCLLLVWTHRNNYARAGERPFKREVCTKTYSSRATFGFLRSIEYESNAATLWPTTVSSDWRIPVISWQSDWVSVRGGDYLLRKHSRTLNNKWLEREFTDWMVRGSDPTSASRLRCLGLDTLAVFQPSGFLLVAYRLGTKRVLQLNSSYHERTERQLNVLHQAASCSSCYDIRDIAKTSLKTSQTGDSAGFQATECAAPGRLMFQLLRYSRYRENIAENITNGRFSWVPGKVHTGSVREMKHKLLGDIVLYVIDRPNNILENITPIIENFVEIHVKGNFQKTLLKPDCCVLSAMTSAGRCIHRRVTQKSEHFCLFTLRLPERFHSGEPYHLGAGTHPLTGCNWVPKSHFANILAHLDSFSDQWWDGKAIRRSSKSEKVVGPFRLQVVRLID
ncbi:hypothetical protein CLF_112149 [Clonorchis sinensis]|uniref:Uncharacterized protein n=1 Tax=Clonorchis sinensis TaxID=79923 RepID=G7YMA9_CLOSI|nr:hypothetical protein CLF_112149 [Clonorchis sinensis]